jgi:hypothetical protein
MASTTLRPNDEAGGPSVVTGTGDAADVTNDTPDDDATYFTKTPGEDWTVVALDSTSMPADSMMKLLEPRIRMRSNSGGQSFGEIQLRYNVPIAGDGYTVLSSTPFAVGTSFVEQPALSVAAPYMTQAQLDDLRLAVRCTSGEIQVSELFLDVTIAEQGTTTVTGPTGTQTTSVVLGAWTHTAGVDGGTQAAWESKYYSAAQFQSPSFDPDITTATQYFAAENSAGSRSSNPLSHGTDYRHYARTAQRVGGVLHWNDWDFETFTVDVVAPDVASITLTVDSAFARAVADIERAVGDAWDHVELQRMSQVNLIPEAVAEFSTDTNADGRADDWDSDVNGTVSTTFSLTGGYQRMAVTGISDAERQNLQVGELVRVASGESYTVIVTAKAPTLGANTALSVGIRWFDHTGSLLSTFGELILDSSDVSSTAAAFSMSAEAPELAAYGAPFVSVVGLTGASGASTTGDFKNVWFVLGDETDVWEDVVGATDTVVSTDEVTIVDYGIPGDTPSLYRARAVDANDNAGLWLYSTEPVEWEQTASWLKSRNRPGFNTTFCLAVRPEFDEPIQQGIHEVIDDPSPITVSGPRQLRRGTIEIETETLAEYQAIRAVLHSGPVALFQFLPSYGLEPMWASLGKIRTVLPEEKTLTLQFRTIYVDVTELSTSAVEAVAI